MTRSVHLDGKSRVHTEEAMSRILIAVTTLTSLSAVQASAQQHDRAASEENLRKHLFTIADDSMMGRETGSLGNFKTAEYVAEVFRLLGLEPAGDDGTFFQTVPLGHVAVDRESYLGVSSTRLGLGDDFLPLEAASGVRSLSAGAIFGGYVIDSTSWLTADELAGKFVVMPLSREGAARPVNPGAVLANPRFARAVAVAVVELDLLPPALVGQLIGGRMTTQSPVEPEEEAAGIGILVTTAAAEQIMGASLNGLTPGEPGKSVEIEIAVSFVPLEHAARNVVAILRGRDPTVNGQYISLTAHNDHTGTTSQAVDHDSLRAFNRIVRPMGADSPRRQPTTAEEGRIGTILDSLRALNAPRPDSIMNGADDDGSGTVVLLEIARSLTAMPGRPRRSILFVSHAAEEVGLVGSSWFTDNPTVPRDSIIAEMDMDMVGRGSQQDNSDGGPEYLEVIGSRRLSTELGDILEEVNGDLAMPFAFNYEYDAPGHPLQYYCRADHYSYARHGIPSISLSRGAHLDYHQVTDEPQYISYPDLARVARLAQLTALQLANLDHRIVVDKPRPDPNAPCEQ
jgi:hypothetical protein